MRIVLTGGGEGGHLTPFEPIVAALRSYFLEHKTRLPHRLEPSELTIFFAGLANQETKTFLDSYDVTVVPIPSGKLRRYFSIKNIIDLGWHLPRGILLALWQMWRLMPEIVISKGGYGSLPVVLAAVFYRIPVLLHESDIIPGLANRIVTRFAAAVAVGWPTISRQMGRWQYKTIVTGTPSRTVHYHLSQAEAKTVFGLPPDEPLLLVAGGSQGARQLNEALLQVLPQLVTDMAIIHLTGDKHFAAVSAVAKELLAAGSRGPLYKPFAHLTDKMIAALVAADAVVTRAGATTLAELTALRKPMLLIPYPDAAGDHQRQNAQAYEAAGAALVLEPNNLGAHLMEQNIRRLMTDTRLRQTLTTNLQKMDYPHAARDIAKLAFTLAQGLAPVTTQP